MKTIFSRMAGGIMMAAFIAGRAASAATLNLTPSSISNTYVGPIALNISDLVAGETVRLDHYADVNANGVIDSNDLLVGSFLLTNGVAATIGGVTNLNVPCDLTDVPGVINAVLNYLQPEPQFPSGANLFRLSSVAGHWPPVTNSFAVTNYPFPQVISGQVTNGSTNVPYAFVGIRPSSGGFAGGTFCDSNGNYSLPVAPGTYELLASKFGCVYNAGAAPSVTLTTPGTVTANLSLAPATTTLGGRLVDSIDTNYGLPGLFLFMQSGGGFSVFGWTDINGNFGVPVTADVWRIQISDRSGLAALGRMEISGNIQALPTYDTTGGSVTNALIPLPVGTAMFYGRITNSAGAPLAGVQFDGGVNSAGIYTAFGISDTNGDYTMLALAGSAGWNVNMESPGPANYVVSLGGGTNFCANQAVEQDFLAEPATDVIMGQVTNSIGAPVSGLEINGEISVGNFTFQSSEETGADGDYSLPAFNGMWSVQPNCNDAVDGLNGLGYNCADGQCVWLSSASATANFTAYPLPVEFSNAGFSGPGQFSFEISAVSGYTYDVQVSTNLANSDGWVTFLTTNLQSDSVVVTDTNATNQARFYRALHF